MKRLLMGVVFLMATVAALQAKPLVLSTSKTKNLAQYDFSELRSLKKGDKTLLKGFYPVGFSKEGWFAYTQSPDGDLIDFEGGSCKKPPCLDGITLINLYCTGDYSGLCMSDAPTHAKDFCYCPMGARFSDLKKFEIQPIETLRSGSFPIVLDDDTIDLKIVYKEKAFPSEALSLDPKTGKHLPVELVHPGTELVLVSKKRGEKVVALLDHHHGLIAEKSVQKVGWIKAPYSSRWVILVSYIDSAMPDGVVTAVVRPIGVDLDNGFEKK